jgi:hypothetical protein
MNWLQVILSTLLLVNTVNSVAGDLYITTTTVNVRTGPGTKYEVIFILPKEEEVEVLSKSDSWYQIKHKNITGYVHINYLQFKRTISVTNLQELQQMVSYMLIGAYCCLALFLGSILFVKIRNRRLLKSVTSLDRGTKTERDLVLRLLKYGISAQDIFHDLYLEKGIKDFAQIDLVALTQVGIIVFEVKNYGGWIFGSGHQQQWTQVLNYGKQKYHFYNPIMQNTKHVADLRKQVISLGDTPIFSCVVFFGDCVLKEINLVPNGTFLAKQERIEKILKNILKDNSPVHYANREEIVHVLQQAVANGALKEIRKQHVENIKDMLGKHRIFE